MTTTARDTVYRALRMLGVSDPEETPVAPQLEFGLVALNQMVQGWKSQGVDIFGSFASDWTADTIVDVLVPQGHKGALAALLAIDLQPEYPGSQISPECARMASQGWAALQSAYMPSSVDADLTAPGMFQRISRSLRGGGWYQG